MNFIAATVEVRSHLSDSISAYGLDYCGANAVVPSNNSDSEVRFRLLCYDREGAKLNTFKNWKEGTRALVTGHIVFTDDPLVPLDLILTTIEPNIPQDMYCNQVVLGNAFFGSNDIKERKNGSVAIKVGTSLDNSDVVTWLFMETHESRRPKLVDRIRKGRPICIQGYLREYRKVEGESPYRAIVANDFTTRKDRQSASTDPTRSGTATGYAEVDPTPDY